MMIFMKTVEKYEGKKMKNASKTILHTNSAYFIYTQLTAMKN
jgi:hypothetical protein